MKHGKVNKRLRSAWYKKDFDLWLDMLIKKGLLSEKSIQEKNKNFVHWSKIWNDREDIKHKEGNYPNWNPYCGNDKGCSSTAMDRMIKVSYGWYCKHCGLKLGKHLCRVEV